MPETLHVVALGDSLAYGAGDETGEGIAGRLEDVLARPARERRPTVVDPDRGIWRAERGEAG